MSTRATPAIIGLGCAVPQACAEQEAAAQFLVTVAALTGDGKRLVDAIYSRSGIAARGSVVLNSSAKGCSPLDQSFYREKTSPNDGGPSTADRMQAYATLAGPLAVAAARSALQDAVPFLSHEPSKAITHLVTVSCTGFAAPGVDMVLIEALGLAPSVQRLNIGFMGCHGGVIALRTARDLAIAGGPECRVLVVCVELCSLHLQYSDRPGQIVANALFGDGAAAAVVASDGSMTGGNNRRNGAMRRLALRSSTSTLVPGTAECMGWTIGDHGFEMSLAASVPAIIREHLPRLVSGWLETQGTSLEEARSHAAWAVHPGGPKILEAVGEALDLKRSALNASREILRNHGNMSSPTVLFILNRLTGGEIGGRWDEPLTSPIVMLGFGPGLTVEGLMLAPME
ncbi:MAG: type III polyketide synthase [Phycisphaerales bacterium]|nr:type III polyketide synthase [Phycisphaerales bacterium]